MGSALVGGGALHLHFRMHWHSAVAHSQSIVLPALSPWPPTDIMSQSQECTDRPPREDNGPRPGGGTRRVPV